MTPRRRAITTAVNSPSAFVRIRAVNTFYIWKILLGLLAEEHGGNLRYWLPVVVIKMIWNLAIVAVSAVTLILTVDEKPNDPIRLWISVYSLQCVVRVLILWSQYMKRNTRTPINNVMISTLIRSSTVLETLNSGFTQIWLWTGSWYTIGAKKFPNPDAPCLYWLTMGCVLPGMFDLYIRASHLIFGSPFIKKAASADAGISKLPKYRFKVSNRIKNMKKNKKNDEHQADGRVRRMVPMQTNGQEFSAERVLLVQDVDGCICLCNYEDGAELCLLPCNHHFHSGCIRQWLMLKPTCPLCERGMIR